jgi:hypothetical protein
VVNVLRSFYLQLDANQKSIFLVSLISNLTICGRGAYPEASGDMTDEDRWRQLQAVNELMHTIAGQLLVALCAVRDRYPDDVFCDIVCEKGTLVDSFGWALRESMKGIEA